MALTQQEVTKINNLYKKIDELTNANNQIASSEINDHLNAIEETTSKTLQVLQDILSTVNPEAWQSPAATPTPKSKSKTK
jgi:hypothetical protein